MWCRTASPTPSVAARGSAATDRSRHGSGARVVNAARKVRRKAAAWPLPKTAPDGEASELVDELAALIVVLPERQRLAIFLRYYADLDYRAIADALGIEVGTVSATLATAHASLRNALMEVQR